MNIYIENAQISVLMAVHNGIPFLEETINSILGQTLPDFEFIIVNDSSNDGSVDLINQYALIDKRIKLIHNTQEKGLANSLNIGLRASNNKIVARQDADDISYPDRLEKQVSYLNKHSDVSVLGSWAKLINKDGVDLGKIRKVEINEEMIPWEMLFSCPLIHPSVIFRKKDILKVGGYSSDFPDAEDFELWSKLCFDHYKIRNIPETTICYRIHDEQVTKKSRSTQISSSIKIITQNLIKLGLPRPSNTDVVCLEKFWSPQSCTLNLFQTLKYRWIMKKVLKLYCQRFFPPESTVKQIKNELNWPLL